MEHPWAFRGVAPRRGGYVPLEVEDTLDVTTRAEQAGQQADDSIWMDYAVRLGLVSYGVVHLVLAWLALRLAFGDSSSSASSQGALHELASNGVGLVSLYVAGVGFLALVVWQGLEAVWGHRREEGFSRVRERLTSAAKVVLYGALAFSSFKTAAGSSSGSEKTDGITARLMSLPAGPWLVGTVGVGIIAIAGFLLHRGISEGFRDKLDIGGETGADGKTYLLLAKAGYISKAAAIAVVGSLFVYAALTNDPDKSGGLDQALHKVLQQPFGTPLLVVIAVGFACYGLFCFAWARHLDR
jgi:hypothetical protein